MFIKTVITVVATLFAATLLSVSPVQAQDGSNLDSIQCEVNEAREVNNGTNPTLLTTQMGFQYQYSKINSNLNTGLLEFFYQEPFGGGSKALKLTVPFADNPNFNPNSGLFEDATLGDISLTFFNVFHLTSKAGVAYTAELFFDTAKNGAGIGEMALETSLYYAKFLESGGIFAPAWVQTFGLEGGAIARGRNST